MRGIDGLRVFITTCDRYLWTLKGFAYCFNKYWSEKQQVVVGCYKTPEEAGIKLPPNFTSHQIQPKDLDVTHRSDGLIKFFRAMPDEFFLWMLEDFWLVDYVDIDGIEALFHWMKQNDDVLRIDLTADRFVDSKAGSWDDAGKVGHLDLILSRPGNRYLWSHQGALWNKALMLPYMQPHEGSHKASIEVRCTGRLNRDHAAPKVYGTKNWPLKYAHVVRKYLVAPAFVYTDGKVPIPVEDIAEMRKRDLIGARTKKFDKVKRRGWK